MRLLLIDADIIIISSCRFLFRDLCYKKPISDHIKPGAIVTDVGSVKKSLIKISEKLLPKALILFLGIQLQEQKIQDQKQDLKDCLKVVIVLLNSQLKKCKQRVY